MGGITDDILNNPDDSFCWTDEDLANCRVQLTDEVPDDDEPVADGEGEEGV